MKKIKIFILLFCISSSLISQTDTRLLIDSLNQILSKTKEDTARVRQLNKIADMYYYLNIDSAILLSQQSLALARQINYREGEADALDVLGWALNSSGNTLKALETYLKCIKLADENNLTYVKTAAQQITSFIYRDDLEDYKTALNLLRESSTAFYMLGDYSRSLASTNGIAYTYLTMNQIDSAEFYLKTAFNEGQRLALDSNNWFYEYYYITEGLLFQRKNQLKKAAASFLKSIDISKENNEHIGVAFGYYRLGNLYYQSGNIDSALVCAKISFEEGRKGNYYKRMILAADQLAKFYEEVDLQLALQYSRQASTIRDSLSNLNKLNALINLVSFDEKEKAYEIDKATIVYRNKIRTLFLVSGIGVLLLLAFIFYRNNRQKHKAKLKIEKAYNDLKATQQQLIQSEKMASLGELTAGIAHEIQNPLNFVNNFSEVNNELIEEVKSQIPMVIGTKLKIEELDDLLIDILQNNEKINHHGKRADAIVKGMLQHSRSSTGQKELTDINALANEYLRLAYHGLRAKDKSFNATTKTEFDNSIGKVNVVPQDIGRVILNLINKAFYAIDEKKNGNELSTMNYEPTVIVSTKKEKDKIEVKVKDNGMGISQKIFDKIFQPFFTTKPTGQGTGLGLSLAYDIVKAHAGELKVETKEGEGSAFIIQLPLNASS